MWPATGENFLYDFKAARTGPLAPPEAGASDRPALGGPGDHGERPRRLARREGQKVSVRPGETEQPPAEALKLRDGIPPAADPGEPSRPSPGPPASVDQ
jgi:hypothetical protein